MFNQFIAVFKILRDKMSIRGYPSMTDTRELIKKVRAVCTKNVFSFLLVFKCFSDKHN